MVNVLLLGQSVQLVLPGGGVVMVMWGCHGVAMVLSLCCHGDTRGVVMVTHGVFMATHVVLSMSW